MTIRLPLRGGEQNSAYGPANRLSPIERIGGDVKRIVAASVAAAIGWSCSSGGSAGSGMSVETPEPVAPARAQLRPGSHTYLLVSQRSVQRVIEGQPMADTSFVRLQATVDIDESFDLEFRVDSLIEARPRPDSEVAGAQFTGQTTASGGVTGFSPPDDASPIIQTLSDIWRGFIPRLPEGGAAPGSTWSDTLVDTRSQSGAEMRVAGETHYRSGDWAPQTGGDQALSVAWERDYTVNGTGEQFGQQFNITGIGRATGSMLISATGAVIGHTQSSEMRGEISIPTMGITFPIAQLQIDSVRVRQP